MVDKKKSLNEVALRYSSPLAEQKQNNGNIMIALGGDLFNKRRATLQVYAYLNSQIQRRSHVRFVVKCFIRK